MENLGDILGTYGRKDVIVIDLLLYNRKSFYDHAENGEEYEELVAPRVYGCQTIILGLCHYDP